MMNKPLLSEQPQRVHTLRAQITILREELRALGEEVDAYEPASGSQALSCEQRFRQVSDTLPNIVWTAKPDGKLDYVNKAFIELTSHAPDGELGQAWLRVIHPEDRARGEAAWKLALTQQHPYEVELRLRRGRDGAYLWHLVRAEPMRDAQGAIVKWYGRMIDIHTRRAAEERAQLLSRATHDVIWDWDIQRDTLWWNEGFETRFGHPLDDHVRGLSAWSQHLHPDDQAPTVAALAQAIAQQQTQWMSEYRFAKRDGSYAYVLNRGYIMRDEHGTALRVIGGMTDLSEHKAAQERLIEQAELIEKAQDAILVRDLQGRIRYINHRAELLYGWRRDEVIGQDMRQLQFAGNIEMFERANAATLREGAWAGELEQRRSDDKVVLVEARWTLLRRADQKPYGILAINTDISERKRLEQHILRAQRLESIGTLAGGITHDLNNVLTPIMFCAALLREQEEDSQRLEDLDTIERCAKRGSAMIAQLLLFARGDEVTRAKVAMGAIVRDIEHLVRDTFPKNIVFRAAIDDKLWAVLGDATQLNQVLMNLCVNARDAMPRGGTITLTLTNVILDELDTGLYPGVSAGHYVMLRVEDTGEGMMREVLERMFEPFYTTKAQGKGTGLGLSTTHSIVKRHGGFIHAYSELGRGTQLHLYLPAEGGDEEANVLTSQPVKLPHGRGERVLVVDDEENIRHMVKRTLERFGYQVMLASNGAEAIALYAQHQAEIDVILTDMAMPVMDGAALISAARAITPQVKIISSSGLDANGKGSGELGAQVDHFMAKPYTAELMLHTLRRALDDDAPS